MAPIFRVLLVSALLAAFVEAQAQGSDTSPVAPPTLAPEPPPLPAMPDLKEQITLPPAGPVRLPGAGPRLSLREEPGWFRIGLPDGWQAAGDRASGRIALTGPNQQTLHVWLLLVPRSLQPADAATVMTAVSADVAPQTQWSSPRARSRGERITLTAHGREGDLVRAAGLAVVNADRVAVLFYTLASAPRASFRGSRDLFAAILESFVPLPGQGPASGAAVNVDYVRWSDPAEGAFSVDVPKGWTVRGGVVRKSAVDVRSFVQLLNPDQSILIQTGDADIPPFLEPWGLLREGQWDGTTLVRRYVPGAQFGREYLDWRLKPAIPDLAIEAMRPLPKLQEMIQSIYNHYAVPGIERRADVGEVLFRGTWQGQSARGHLYVATTRVAVQGGIAMWFTGDIANLQGFVAPESKLDLAIAVMARMRESFAVNPQWFAGQQRTTAEVSRITSETNRYISDLISRTYARTQRTYDRIFERYSRFQRGVVHVVDPQTQTRYALQTGSNYYWITDRGVIVGTNAHFNPDPMWFREMLTIDP